MKRNFPALAEKAILALICILIIFILGCLIYLLRLNSQPEQMQEPTSAAEETTEPTLAGADFYLPQALRLGEKLPHTVFRTADGEAVDLADYAGTPLILMYWGSWCPYCEKQLENLPAFRDIASEAGATLILVDKTDPAKEETVEKAEAYLEQQGWQDIPHIYDIDLTAYQAYGMKRIPTTIILDGEGYVRAMVSDVLDSGDALSDLLRQAEVGYADSLLSFLTGSMMNADGGLYTAYRPSTASSPSGHDVLSESMGLLMQCAAALDNQELFEQSWRCTSGTLKRNGIFAWYADDAGKPADANALLDDLRIAGALLEANRIWGGYETELEDLALQILICNTYGNQLCSFYDFRQKCSGSTISLAYADFAVLEALAEINSDYLPAIEKLRQTVDGGFIGEDFPLYYSSYDYKQRRYSRDDLNTAEALMTLYHLSGTDLLRPASLEWLRNALQTGTLAARYRTDGKPVSGYQYDSTAVYALAALIGQRAGDSELYHIARTRMEQTRITDPDSPFYGAFSHSNNGSDLNSFDQLLPLLVYTLSKNAKF